MSDGIMRGKVARGKGDRAFGDEGQTEHRCCGARFTFLVRETVAEQPCRKGDAKRRVIPAAIVAAMGYRPGSRPDRPRRHSPPC
jgi:hypothetical protein